MKTFELVSSDFWGKCPEKLVYELDDDVCADFDNLTSAALDDLCRNARNGGTGKNLVTRGMVAKREVLCKLELSTNMETAVFTFRAKRSKAENTGAFYAYCLWCIHSAFDGFASCIMGNDAGDYLCEVALKHQAAKDVLLHVQFWSQKFWIENG